MSISINPVVWGSIFAVPTCVADEHIKMANGQQLKVLLYVLRHNNEAVDLENIAQGVGMSVADVKDAMQYWTAVGLVYMDETRPVNIQDSVSISLNTPKGTTVNVATGLLELPDVVPTHEQVAARVLESPELKALYNEAQLKFGKTIGYDIQAKLLMIYDHYGLPVEVILTIIEFAVKQGKTSISYIQKVAKDWAESGITTLEAADAHLKEIQAGDKLWNKFASMFSAERPGQTAARLTYLKKWHLEHKQSLELIYYACEETVNRTNKMNFNYMDKMLESWYNDKLKSPVDVMQVSKRQGAPEKALRTGVASSNAASYDLEKVQRKKQQPIEYKRRNQNG